MNILTIKSFSEEKFNINHNYIPSGDFYFGINPTGEKDDLKNIFDFLMLGNQEKIYSDNKRYTTQYGCKLRDCGNKGLLWIDNKEKISIGIISHTFWGKLDFSQAKKNQIFLFTNSSKKIDELPIEFKSIYKKWLMEKKISPTLIRYYNSDLKIIEKHEYK